MAIEQDLHAVIAPPPQLEVQLCSQPLHFRAIRRIGAPLALPLPVHANAEGLCVEPRGAGGSTRLWVVSDDNGLPVMAQRLVAWDVPDDAWPKAPEGADD